MHAWDKFKSILHIGHKIFKRIQEDACNAPAKPVLINDITLSWLPEMHANMDKLPYVYL